MIFVTCCWILFASIFWESLHLYSLKILVYNSLLWIHLYWVSECM
jgi:hypothetical protein